MERALSSLKRMSAGLASTREAETADLSTCGVGAPWPWYSKRELETEARVKRLSKEKKEQLIGGTLSRPDCWDRLLDLCLIESRVSVARQKRAIVPTLQ